MAAYPRHPVAGICKEHRFVVRIRSVGRIGQPEILPDHYAVAVAGIVESLVRSLSDPVADHIEILQPVIADSDVVLFRAVVQVLLGEAPVSAHRVHPHSIDVQVKRTVAVFAPDFADSCLEMEGVGYLTVHPDNEAGVI